MRKCSWNLHLLSTAPGRKRWAADGSLKVKLGSRADQNAPGESTWIRILYAADGPLFRARDPLGLDDARPVIIDQAGNVLAMHVASVTATQIELVVAFRAPVLAAAVVDADM